MHKRAGDSSLATISASSPVLREKNSNQYSFPMPSAFGASDASSSWSAAQGFPCLAPEGACTLRIPGGLMFSFLLC